MHAEGPHSSTPRVTRDIVGRVVPTPVPTPSLAEVVACMMIPFEWRVPSFLVALMLVACGCQESSPPGGVASQEEAQGPSTSDRSIPEGTANPDAAAARREIASGTPDGAQGQTSSSVEQPPVEAPPGPPRTSVDGRWELTVNAYGAEFPGLLLDIATDGAVKVVDDSESMPGWKVASADIDGNNLHLELTNQEGAPVDLRGTLKDGEILGNVAFGLEGIELVRLLPSQRKTLDGAHAAPPPEPRRWLRSRAGEIPSPIGAKIARQISGTALAYEIYRGVFSLVKQIKPDVAEVKSLIDEYLAAAEPWGPRVVARTHLDIGYNLAAGGYDSSLAINHLDLAEKQLGADATPAQLSRLTLARGLAFLRSEKPDDQQLGATMLKEIRAEEPFNVTVTQALGAFAEQQGQDEEALRLYGELAVLPDSSRNAEPVTNLWTKLGREADQLGAFLDGIYKDTVHRMVPEGSPPTPVGDNQRVTLCELFTGATCPPCVAADLATGALEVAIPQSMFIAVRYHQHIPGPDPLVAEAGEQRAEFYQIQGTPSLFLNGAEVQVSGMYGPMFNAGVGYTQLREQLTPMLAETTDLRISVTADRSGSMVKVNAQVEGLPSETGLLRLRMCLVEPEISLTAPNGIRLHENVVRAMPGGAEGIAVKEGKLTFAGEVDVEQIRSEILAGLEEVESQLNQPFAEKPLDLAELRVVAFVQNDKSREVLQSVIVDVSGE